MTSLSHRSGSGRLPRILMLSFFSFPLEGGAEKQGRLLACALRDRGVEVAYVAARLPGMPAYEECDGVPIYRILCAPWVKGLRKLIGFQVYMLALLVFLIRRGGRFDILHCHGAFDASAAPTVLAARFLHRASLIKYASENELQRLRLLLLGRWLEPIVRRADMNVTNSLRTLQVMLDDLGLDPDRCVYIPNGIIPPMPGCQATARRRLGLPEGPLAVCVSNFSGAKNQALLIRAWPEVLAHYQDARLIFVGDGPLLAGCQAQVAALGIGGSVIFAGRQVSVGEYLDAADLFVFPSAAEGLSNALMEAMAHERACVVSDIPGNRALITPGQDGLVFDPDEPHEVAGAVICVLADPNLRRALGSAARIAVLERFGMEQIVTRYIELYQSLMQYSAETYGYQR